MAGPRISSREPILSIPPVVLGLLWVMIAVFALQWFLPVAWGRRLEMALAFIPLRFQQGLYNGGDAFSLALPLFGHMFLHGGLIHIASNALWLVIFGTGVARRFGAEQGEGAARLSRNIMFLTYFLLCGLGGVIFYYAIYPSSPVPLVGASGAISGLMAGTFRVVLRPLRGAGRFDRTLARLFSGPVLIATVAFVIMNLLTAFASPSLGEGIRIAWEAHIGGFLVGLLTFPIFDRAASTAR
ncbi:hypothetical protein PB2503_12659 [Parvularcula bermudensis HTCC2503]|uniref:Peptidase S54 rhomboid domain-containing protein n=1 Tax=Parvularcula bermudensis (strain ATCC BAA-594 / HTCC2503 / KCTC 12087) TaxID=314260 RepID=E0TFK9_PARBH|nr:rhomboid family intramembrane serine protease [Parvularcula bermudensis]ADM10569.1 hypothetical protein PB2503_12659 [Parvularcula bermudensis HTCC2503]